MTMSLSEEVKDMGRTDRPSVSIVASIYNEGETTKAMIVNDGNPNRS